MGGQHLFKDVDVKVFNKKGDIFGTNIVPFLDNSFCFLHPRCSNYI